MMDLKIIPVVALSYGAKVIDVVEGDDAMVW